MFQSASLALTKLERYQLITLTILNQMTNKKQTAYTRGKYKPRTKDARKGKLVEGSERWLMQTFGITRHQARKLKQTKQ